MNKINSSNAELREMEFVISRQFNAPQELVWKAFTEPERLAHWWGPKEFSMVNLKLELRHGGIFHYCMKSPNGLEMWGKFVYLEIVPIEKIVYVNSFSDAEGNLTRHPLSTLWPLEVHNTLTLTDENGKTTLTLKGKPINATEEERRTFEAGFTSMQQGFKGTFDQLDIYLSKRKEEEMPNTKNEIVITRIFDAPRELVWKAWTEPEHCKKWWGPNNFTIPYCEIDLRVGGKYLNCMRSQERQEFWSTGVYREIIPLEKIVCTDSFSDEKGNVVHASHYGMPGDEWSLEMLVTITLEEENGKTKMILRHEGLPTGSISEQTNVSWNESFDKLTNALK